MIKYILKCSNEHEFESWFSSSKEFDKLKKKNLVECIFCSSIEVEKSIMSPQVLTKKQKNPKDTLDQAKYIKIKNHLLKIRDYVEKNFKFVGDKFSKEVRSIYYDSKKSEQIYGSVTQEERKELEEEGIELTSIPWIEKDKN
tara:strand:+ start:640 stop:1065 length:426 start_codon:yes stop_codon:yes gene_type:complete